MIVSTFFIKNPPLSCIHLANNVNSVKTHYIMGPKVKKNTLFLRFFTKKTATSYSYFVKKTSILLKPCSHAHILSKNVHSLKNTVFSFNFSKFSMKNTLLSCTYLVQKTLILSKLHGKKVNRIPSFSDFHGKINALIPIFC